MIHTTEHKNILLVLPVAPYPARANGISIRYWPIIQYLYKRHNLDAIIFDDQNVDIEVLKKYFGRISVIGKPKNGNYSLIKKIILIITSSFPWTAPISYAHYNAREIIEKLKLEAGKTHYDCIVWVTPAYADFIFSLVKAIKPGRVIIDFIDSPYLHSKRESVGSFKSAFLQKYETWKTKLWEQRLVKFSNSCIYISSIDSHATSINNNKKNISHVIPNGVYSQDYIYDRFADIKSPCIGFLGNMQYPPNIEAVLWLYNEVFIPLKENIEELKLYIVGKNPDDSIMSLDGEDVIVTGTVESIWPYVNAIDIFLFPLMRGAGMKNKVLDVMYARRPVVTTAIGNEGINSVCGKDLKICNTADEFIRETEKLFISEGMRKSIGESARQFVTANYSIKKIAKDYENVILNG